MAASPPLMLADLISAGTCSHVPANYIRPISDRPNLEQVVESSSSSPSTINNSSSIPVIDLCNLQGPLREDLIKEVGHACQNYGFFQVKNHGISNSTIYNMLQIANEFFKLPEGERMKSYSDDPSKPIRLCTSFNVKTEKVSSWRDFLRLHSHPLEDYIHEWPTNPPSFREDVGEYCKNVRSLALTLLELISESLGLKKDYMEKVLGQKHEQHISINYYPPCPEPDLAYGLPGHTDPTAITILLQDDVPGLQVLHDGKWIAVKPNPETLVVNIGDQIQILSNDRYKSVLHRAVVNNSKERISIPTFYFPSYDAVIEPAQELIDDDHDHDHDHGPLYRRFTFIEFYKKFWDGGLATETCVDMFRASA